MKEILITSSALILAVLLLRRLFRSSISRQVQYAIWLLVLLRLLLPVQLPAAGYSVLSAAQPLQETVEAAARERVYLLPYAAYPTEFYTPEELPDRQPGTVFLEGEGSYGVVDGTGENVVFYRERVQPLQVLTFIWYIGMGVMALWFLGSNLRFARKLRRTRLPLQDVDSAYPVYLCDDIPAPCLFGLLRPAIYVTSEAARDETRLRHVLAHEETHARHLDPLWSALRGLCLVLWWFDPLVWLAARCAKTDCELACDEGALARLGETERRAYGETLLALIPQRRSAHPLLAATSMTAGKRQMRDRITRIASRRRPALLALLAALALVCCACAVSFAGGEAGEEHAPAENTATLATLRPGERPLSGAELEFFNRTFFKPQILVGDAYQINLHNQFLSSHYASAVDVDLFELFYNGVGADYPLSDAEFQLVGTDVCPTVKLPADALDRAFYLNTGLHLNETSQLGLDRFPYLADYDSYYHTHGDTNYCGPVTMSAGTREGDMVRLWYCNGDWNCVTLKDAGDGVWHFVSHLPSGKPAIPTALPEGEPWAVIPLDDFTPVELPPVTLTVHRNDCAERLGGWSLGEGDRVTVRLYRSTDGNTYAAVVDREEGGVWEARSFLTLPAGVRNPEVRFFQDLFGCAEGLIISYDDEIARNTYGQRCHYFAFAADGTPTPVAELPCFGDTGQILDLDGDGTNELASVGWSEAWIYCQRNGTIYAAPVCPLLQRYLGDLTFWSTGLDANYRCLRVSGYGDGVHFRCSLYFDGDRLLVYRDSMPPVTEHVMEGVEGPAEVLADANAILEARVRNLIERKERGESTWAPDDWCISSLERTLTERGDWSIETWCYTFRFHTQEPDKVVWAGSTYVTEDGWVIVGIYGEEPYLFYQLAPDGTRRRLAGSILYLYGPDNPVLFPAMLSYLELRNGLRGPGDIGGVELWRMYRYADAADTLNRLGAAGPEVCADALARMVEAAQRVDPEQLEWGYGLIGDSDALTEEGRAARELLRGILEASEEA